MLRLVFLITLALIGGCASNTTDPLPYWHDLDDFERDWYSSHLMAAREPALPNTSRKTIVRLTWLRSFHNPIVVRVECGLSCRLFSTRLSGAGGYEPGEIAESHRVRLNRSQEERLLRLVSDTLNYDPPADDERSMVIVDGEVLEEIVVHTDGANWVVEIVSEAGYKASSTHGSDLRKGGPLADLCNLLVSVSKIEIPEGEYY